VLKKIPTIWIKLIGFPYASIMLFSAFGPVLKQLVGVEQSWALSTVFLPFLVSGLLVAPSWGLQNRLMSLFLSVGAAFLGLAVLFFPYMSTTFHVLFFAIIGLYMGRMAVFWAYHFQRVKDSETISLTFIWVLVLVFGVQWVVTIVAPVLSHPWPTLPVALMLLAQGQSFFLFHRQQEQQHRENSVREAVQLSHIPWALASVLFLVYLTAGFTFTNIYNTLAQFETLDRYINVLPLLFSLPLAWKVQKRFGLHGIAVCGVVLLGLAFIAFHLPLSSAMYFLAMVPLEMGWGFMNYFSWRVGASWARHGKNPALQMQTVAAFLTGTFIGSMLFVIIGAGVISPGHPMVSLIYFSPLILAIPFLRKKYLDPANQR